MASSVDGLSSRIYRAVSTVQKIASRRYWLSQRALLIQLARETRNYRHRILVTIQARLFERGVDLGPLCRKDARGCYLECSDTRARSDDTQRLYKERPWVTVLDAEMFLAGWTKGSQFRLRNPDT
jgi:hypothetical protein